MALTKRLRSIISQLNDEDTKQFVERSHNALFKLIRESRAFPTDRGISILDMRTSPGSPFVRRYMSEFATSSVHYLMNRADSLRKFHSILREFRENTLLDKPPTPFNIPYQDGYFDLIDASSAVFNGIVANYEMGVRDDSAITIARESYRVLKPGGIFLFLYDEEGENAGSRNSETLINLSRIGFGELEHLQRTIHETSPVDLYMTKKQSEVQEARRLPRANLLQFSSR